MNKKSAQRFTHTAKAQNIIYLRTAQAPSGKLHLVNMTREELYTLLLKIGFTTKIGRLFEFQNIGKAFLKG